MTCKSLTFIRKFLTYFFNDFVEKVYISTFNFVFQQNS
nr:MAG TPA: hypothetical protein [Caudoviricetes sp.]